MLFAKATIVWLMFAVIAIMAGAMRVTLLVPWLGEQTAHVVGTIFGSALIFSACLATIHWLRLESNREAWMVGILWLLVTVCFEFLFGHYVMNHTWTKLLADYDIFRGRIWILVLFLQLVSPALASKIRGIL
jgi:hypothetical protein